MLRQNRYKQSEFIQTNEKLERYDNEVVTSKIHDIVITLEAHQLDHYVELEAFIRTIIVAIPNLDNITQNFYETICEDNDFPYYLASIRFDANEIILDYWSEVENSTFDVIFCYENDTWILKQWGLQEVLDSWKFKN